MTRSRLFALVSLAALVAMLLGPGVVAAGEPRDTVGRLVVSAAAFIPADSEYVYANTGIYLEKHSPGGTNYFTAPLVFPVPEVNVRKIILHAYDYNTLSNVCLSLQRASLATATEAQMAQVCSAESSARPQAVSTTEISPRHINTALYAPYLWLAMNQGTQVFGVTVIYSY